VGRADTGCADALIRGSQALTGWWRDLKIMEMAMLAAIRVQTILVVMVILNLIGLTIAAYVILKRK